MLAVTVEVWPGGSPLGRKVIHVLTLANVSGLTELSDYVGKIDGKDIEVADHRRSDGAWQLVKRVLDENPQ